MKFNPSTTEGIVYMTRFYAKANSNDLTLQDIVNLSNISLDEIYPDVAYSSRILNFDDPNYGDDPYETYNIVSGTARYPLTTDGNAASILGVRKVAVANSAGVFSIIELAGLDEVDSQGFVNQSNVAGTPLRYFQFDKTLVFDPTFNYSRLAGIRAFYKRALQHFTSSDTEVTPGFDPNFHDLIPMRNAYRWCRREGKRATALDLKADIADMTAAMKTYYKDKNTDARPAGMKANVENSH